MELSKQAIEEFKDIYYQEFGEKLSDEKARRIGGGLLELFSVVYPFEVLQAMENQSDQHKSAAKHKSE